MTRVPKFNDNTETDAIIKISDALWSLIELGRTDFLIIESITNLLATVRSEIAAGVTRSASMDDMS